jgi:PTH1 family peptidyl-tRNA hydrolase
VFRKKTQPELPPEWLIVGLGNPGAEYRGTRHNVGFEVVELLAKQAKVKLDRSRQKALVTTATIGHTSALLVKPLTYMNLSGQSVGPLAKGAGLKADRVLVIADDLDLPLGKVRFRTEGSAGGHNGHKSVIQALGTTVYPRLKIGIGRGEQTIDHVLSGFHKDERPIVDRAIEAAVDFVELLLNESEQVALHRLERYQASS